MSSTLTATDAIVRYAEDGSFYSTGTVAFAETWIRAYALDPKAKIQQWQTTDYYGRPLRIVRIEPANEFGDTLVFEVQAWYQLGRNVPAFPGLEHVAHESIPELPERAAEFEAFAAKHGWATAVTVTDKVVVVSAGTAPRRPKPLNLIDPTYAESCFTLTWKRHFGRWTLRTQESRTDGLSWGWSSQDRIREHIAAHPFTMPVLADA